MVFGRWDVGRCPCLRQKLVAFASTVAGLSALRGSLLQSLTRPCAGFKPVPVGQLMFYPIKKPGKSRSARRGNAKTNAGPNHYPHPRYGQGHRLADFRGYGKGTVSRIIFS